VTTRPRIFHAAQFLAINVSWPWCCFLLGYAGGGRLAALVAGAEVILSGTISLGLLFERRRLGLWRVGCARTPGAVGAIIIQWLAPAQALMADFGGVQPVQPALVELVGRGGADLRSLTVKRGLSLLRCSHAAVGGLRPPARCPSALPVRTHQD
jgi:hypothetical protein